MSDNRNPSVLPRWRVLLDGAASLSLIVLCVTITWGMWRKGPLVVQPFGGPAGPARRAPDTKPKEAPLPPQSVSLDGAVRRGASTAKIAILEFSDFVCPYCGAFVRDTLPSIEKEYLATGKVQMAFRHLPLEGIHPEAFRAAEAANCAGRQGKFWSMHDFLFGRDLRAVGVDVAAAARVVGLHLDTFQSCLRGAEATAVRADLAAAKALGVDGTPSFFIGTVEGNALRVVARLKGAATFDRFQLELDRLLPRTTVERIR